jgi:glycosyltransferase involved in cell wall biosynthesis
MRILFLSQLVPYPVDAGPKVRIYYVLRYLASAGHDITLAAFCRPEDKPEYLEHLQQFCKEIHTIQMPRSRWRNIWQLIRSVVLNRPFLITRDEVPAMHHLLNSLMKKGSFDAVHADQLWMAQYALKLNTAASKADPPPINVLDQHNAVFMIPQRLAAENSNLFTRALLKLEGRKMAAYESDVCNQFDHVVWVTEEDRMALAQINGREIGLTIPICIDPSEALPIERRPKTKRVTFIGGLHWPPNSQGVIWFMNEVWPLILKDVPEAVFTVIGKNPSLALQKLASGIPSIEVAGYVPNPDPYLAETAAFVVPLHAGGGMRVKILNAWRSGLPIVSTTIGAEGINYENGGDLLIADDAASFAGHVIRLLCEPDYGEIIGQAGRHSVESFYNWHKVYRAWDTVYRNSPS